MKAIPEGGFFAGVLAEEMEKLGFGQTDMARYLGVQQSDIFRWLNRARAPHGDELVRILKLLGWTITPPGFQEGGVAEGKVQYGGKSKGKAAVAPIGTVAIDGYVTGAEAEVQWQKTQIELTVPMIVQPAEGGCLLSVQGDALAPMYPEGSIISISRRESEAAPAPGSIVVLRSNLLRQVFPIKGRSTSFAARIPGREQTELEVLIVGVSWDVRFIGVPFSIE